MSFYTQEARPIELGTYRYLVETEIQGEVVKRELFEQIPRTNRGQQLELGWLGTFTDTAGTAKSRYNRGIYMAIGCVHQPADELIESHYLVEWVLPPTADDDD